MRDPSTLVKLLYQRLKAPDGGNLARLVPRALGNEEIAPGLSEMALTKAVDEDGGGWSSGGLLVPRTYLGFIAVHYAVAADQHVTYPDEAAIYRVLTTFELLPQVQAEPAFRSLGQAPADWFLNTEPTKAQRPAVQTLTFDFALSIDLTLQEGPPP